MFITMLFKKGITLIHNYVSPVCETTTNFLFNVILIMRVYVSCAMRSKSFDAEKVGYMWKT